MYLARQAVAGGMVECALAVGFEKMKPGALTGGGWNDRTSPLDKSVEIMAEINGIEKAPLNPQIFTNGALEYIEKNKHLGNDVEHLHMIAHKNHRAS